MNVYFALEVQAIPAGADSARLGAQWLLARTSEGTPYVLVSILAHAHNNAAIRALTEHGIPFGIPKNFPPATWSGGPVLAPWPDQTVLDAIDSATARITSVCILKWLASDAKAWLSARQAVDILDPTTIPAPATISDPMVLIAMDEVSAVINLSNNLVQRNDRTDAIRRLQYVHEHGHTLNADEIEAWALANGWSRRATERLREVIDRIESGGSFRNLDYGPIRDRGAMYKRWQGLAAGSNTSQPSVH